MNTPHHNGWLGFGLICALVVVATVAIALTAEELFTRNFRPSGNFKVTPANRYVFDMGAAAGAAYAVWPDSQTGDREHVIEALSRYNLGNPGGLRDRVDEVHDILRKTNNAR